MKIFYDSKCAVCVKIRDFLLKIKDEKSREDFHFFEIRESKYEDLSKKTVVIEKEVSGSKVKTFTYGSAMKEIFREVKFPYKQIVVYCPTFLLNIFYIFIAKTRRYMNLKFLKKSLFFIIITIFLSIFLAALYSPSSFLNKLGRYSFLEIHNLNLAEKVLNLSHLIDEQNIETNFLLGRIYFVEGKLNESIKNYRRVLEIDPNYEQAYYGLGLSYGYLKDYKNAETNFKKYIEISEYKIQKAKEQNLNPIQYENGLWAGYNDLAWVYFLQGDFTNAEKVSREALSKWNNPWLLNMLGSSLLNQGKKEEAAQYFEMAKTYATAMNYKDFGEAYTGDDSAWHKKGFEQMKQTIDQNLNNSK